MKITELGHLVLNQMTVKQLQLRYLTAQQVEIGQYLKLLGIH